MVNRINDTNYIPRDISVSKRSVHEKEFDLKSAIDNKEKDKLDYKEQIYESDFSESDRSESQDIIDNSLHADIKQKVMDIVENIKKIFHDIWYGKKDVKDNSYNDNVIVDSNKTISDIINGKNLDEIENYLMDNGNRKIAQNSDLLTTYNKKGRIVDIDPSEKNKIIHGTKSWDEKR